MVASRPEPVRDWSGFLRRLRLTACLSVVLSPSIGVAQQAQPSSLVPGAGLISGKVLDAQHHPVSGEVVRLEAGTGSTPVETVTDASGTFTFAALRFAAYTLSAGHPGTRAYAQATLKPEHASESVALILNAVASQVGTASQPKASSSGNQAVEFSDQPAFTVAGVTDWTAVGGHGSDATLRTSEQMARETVSLKDAKTAKAPGADEDHAEARLRTELEEAPLSYAKNHELGVYYLHTMRYEQAVPLLETASELSHAQAEDEYDLALACRGVGDLKKAQVHVEHALAKKDSADAHRLAGELDEKLGDSLAAVDQYQRAARIDASEENYFAWGSELLLHRAIWQAAEVFKAGARMYPRSTRMLTGWAAALFAGALYDQAASRLCEASDLDPSSAEPYLLMGSIEAAAPGPLPCVEQRLDRFVQAQPASAAANYLYAMALLRRGNTTQAAKAKLLLTRAATTAGADADDHPSAEAYLQLGILAFAQHEDTEAIQDYTKAIELEATLAEAHYRLGVAYQREGERAKAAAEFELHEALEKRQSELADKQRREVKQFEVKQFEVLQGQAPPSSAPH